MEGVRWCPLAIRPAVVLSALVLSALWALWSVPGVSGQTPRPLVSITAPLADVTEGGAVTFTVTRDQGSSTLTVRVSVEETGATLSGAPASEVTFQANELTKSLVVATDDDGVVEGNSEIKATLVADSSDLPLYDVGAAAMASVTVLDNDHAEWAVALTGGALAEGGAGAATLTVSITNNVVFSTRQWIALALGGDATVGTDYTPTSGGWTLAKPHGLTLPAGASAVTAVITVVDDERDEETETIEVAASHDGNAIGLAVSATITDDDASLGLKLSSLAVGTTGRAMYPSFDPDIRHYAVGCSEDDRVTITAAAAASLSLSIGGVQRASGVSHTVTLAGRSDDSVFLIELGDVNGALDTYAVHCLPADFPFLTAVSNERSWDGLTAFSVRVRGRVPDTLSGTSYLIVVDQNGVPRFLRKIDKVVANFRPHYDGQHFWTYGKFVDFLASGARTGRVVILDDNLAVVRAVTTTSALQHTNLHDSVVKPNGNVILMAYEPVQRDLSAFTNPDTNQPYSTTERAEDSVIQEITQRGLQVRLWVSWHHLAIEDCTQHFFPRDYAHVNSLQAVDGDIIASFRGCSQVVRIDGATSRVEWLLGKSNLTAEEWGERNGPAPLEIVGDPYGEFCGQHGARMISPTNLLLFDNGGHCLVDPDTGLSERTGAVFSRAVEYALDLDAGTATFQRHHSLHNTFSHYARSQGHVQLMPNGNWLISWGTPLVDDDPETGAPPDVSVTEVDPSTNEELWTLTIKLTSDAQHVTGVWAYPLREDQLKVSYGISGPPVPPNLDPSFADETWMHEVSEGVAVGAVIGPPIAATDPENDTLTYTIVGGHDLFAVDGNTGQLRTKATLDADAGITHHAFVVQVTDGLDSSSAEDPWIDDAIAVIITVEDVDEPADVSFVATGGVTGATNTLTVDENYDDTLATFTASDPENDQTLTYTWALGGTDRLDFAITATGVLSFVNVPDHERPADSGGNNVYDITVSALDSDGETGRIAVTVTVENVDEPADVSFVATRGVTLNNDTLTVDENYDGPLATFRARDPENEPGLTYTWSTDSPSHFAITSTGVLSFVNIPDYELPAGGTTSYDIAVSALDSDGETGSIAVTVTVEPVDEPPGITLASAAGGDVTVRGSAVSVDENHTGDLVEVTATDPEGTHTDYTFALGGTHSGSFTLSSTGGLRFTNPPDHEARDVYRLRLTASNASESSTLNVTVTVRDVNEPPVIGGEAEVSRNEVEDPRPGQVVTVGTYSKSDPDRPSQTTNWGPVGSSEVLSGADSVAFEFDQVARRLTFASPPDYEDGVQYTVTLTANDGTLEGSLDITVNVANVEETGTLTFVGEVTQGANGVLLQATLTDPDVVATETWVWQRRTGRSGPWMDIANTNASYTPSAADVGQYLRASVTYTDGAGTNETTLTKATDLRTVNDASVNQPPTPPDPLPQVGAIPENASTGRNVVRVVFTDPEGEPLTYSLVASDEFEIVNPNSGQITVQSGGLDYENTPSHEVTVKAADPLGASATATLTVDVMDVNEPPTAVDLPVTVGEDETVDIDVVGRASDQDAGDTLTVAGVVSSPGKGRTTVNDGTNDITYAPQANYNGSDNFTYQVKDQGGLPSNTATVTITVMAVNDAPTFAASPPALRVSETAVAGDIVGAVTATDIDVGDTLTYSLFGTGAFAFEIDPVSGQITVGGGVTLVAQETYEVTVEVDDGSGKANATARIDATITVVAGPVVPPPTSGGGGSFGGGGGGGGGGGASGPSPSTLDFEWTVKRDIEDLDSGHDTPTGLWSDGATLWILENGEGADDAVYAYDQATGERVEGREFALAETNRAPRGFWSNGETVWVSDSGRERLFAYGLASGEREERREVELAERNSDARGIWSDEETMWVLDGGKDSLFAYDLATGDLLAEYSLASRNGDPQGIWSDGVTVWVSDHGAKQLLAYRLPTRPDAPAAEDEDETEDPVSVPVPVPLERVDDEDFTELSSSSNNSPRGIWSDGDFMYVADESDDRVYTYNIPDAIDARLATLTLSGVDIGEFDPATTEYEGTPAAGVMETTVEATAVQRRTSVAVLPDDVDGDEENGHRVSLGGGAEITVTVTSPDGSRERVYRVAFEAPPVQLALAPTWTSIEWPGAGEVTIAEAGLPDTVVAIYTWDEESRSWLAYFPSLEGVPGLNTLATFSTGATYWVAVGEGASWSVEAAPAER